MYIVYVVHLILYRLQHGGYSAVCMHACSVLAIGQGYDHNDFHTGGIIMID